MDGAGRSTSCLPTYSVPTKAEKPAPKRLIASPVAYWFVLSQMTSQPNTAATAAPATAPAASASDVLPVWNAIAKPDTADTSIIPSRSEEHTSELQSRRDLVCRLLLEKKKK